MLPDARSWAISPPQDVDIFVRVRTPPQNWPMFRSPRGLGSAPANGGILRSAEEKMREDRQDGRPQRRELALFLRK